MIVVHRVFSRRFLTQGVHRTASASYLRFLSSEQDGDDKKETSISMLLKSLKQTNTKFTLENVLPRKSVHDGNDDTVQKDAIQKYSTSTKDVKTKKSKHGVRNKSVPDTLASIYNRDRTQPVSSEINDSVKSILSKLKVDRAHSQLSDDIVGIVKKWGGQKQSGNHVKKDFMMQSQPSPFKVSRPISFASGARFEGFDDIFKSHNVHVKETLPVLKLLEGEDADLLDQYKSLDQRNDFFTLIGIADKQWKFPVDNEVCKVEEKDVGFEEHVFLGYLLDNFPKKGPVRMFMELVVNGLEQNPYMTVAQKKDQVFWFKDYFENIPEEDLSF